MELSARDLVVRRGSFVLRVPHLDVGEGGLAVLGPNGAGKTTLLLALQSLIAGEGHVQRPPRTAAVFARPAALRGTTAWNVDVVARNAAGLDPDAARRAAGDAIEAVGLADRRTTDARRLSTGERQRLALARALVTRPQALFLDEPFANVDAEGRPALRAVVRAFCAEHGCTLVVATSSLADAGTMCASLIVLGHGEIVHAAPCAATLETQNGYLRALLTE